VQNGRFGVLERGQALKRLLVAPDYRPKSTRHVVRDFTEALASHLNAIHEFA
jgi:hypothetical protein